ncbi:Sulfite exporter TauE/SafE [Fuerstiella marisgermanici]|uniref:Probable membrane transporter protein n=2 Tax=Fuerstiella marisgermanici TaxID=1891926 RepID=A0A1P8WBN9_9PLAN|nr:Sulfite exporter TauE/SafE [Fuerstiella marisgermanici]
MFEWTLTSILISAAVGSAVGFLSGVFGVGGGFLLVPILNAALGIPMSIAVGSTACYTLGPATTAMLARRPAAGFLQLPLILAGGLLAGVWCGTAALSSLKSAATVSLFGKQVPAVDLMVLSSYAVLMTGIAIMSFVDGLKKVHGPTVRRRGLLSFVPLPPIAVISDLRPSRYSIPLLAWTGLIVGFLSGFLGMSGGLVLVPAAIYLLGLRVHDATTMTIVIVWLVSLQSTFMHALHSHVELKLVVALLICGTIGANIGSQVGMRLQGRQLKLGFGTLVLVAAAIVFARLWMLWR